MHKIGYTFAHDIMGYSPAVLPLRQDHSLEPQRPQRLHLATDSLWHIQSFSPADSRENKIIFRRIKIAEEEEEISENPEDAWKILEDKLSELGLL